MFRLADFSRGKWLYFFLQEVTAYVEIAGEMTCKNVRIVTVTSSPSTTSG